MQWKSATNANLAMIRAHYNGGSSSFMSLEVDGAQYMSLQKSTLSVNVAKDLAVTGTSTLTGKVGIGQSPSGAQLEVRTNTTETNVLALRSGTSEIPSGIYINYTSAAPNNTVSEFLYCSDNTAVRATIMSDGGLKNYQSNNADLSDERLKVIHNPTASKWDAHAALEIVDYHYTESPDTRLLIGVGAHQAGECDERLCATDGWDTGSEKYHAVYTKDLSFYTMKTVQECQARIEALEAALAAM